ncbi:RNAse PH [Chthonomonas calidirosea]|uniref:Ribonuclease PH n=1 Tax=Chthonomonas calidirosea (strain DSM 23976 / ICMP 18418 / T49) TaxID=1303518 RepID=S0ESG3_CHTCT|nr:ribonuclease PH [Chthonomonas calidirosea]CCW34221.1 RNAse PH [Chthonomonas calidirosea T49]CEK15411.1 RNAse PH [Chthonomonas calidirosea]
MPRFDGRGSAQLRPTKITRGFMPNAEGSCLIEMGNTKVICTASVEDKLPPFRKLEGELGWVTAEYGMLPRSTNVRTPREGRNGPSGRTVEIQRLIGRSLRAVVEMPVLEERTILIDCDVLQADGGTRCAAITGSFVALAEACRKLVDEGAITRMPLTGMVAAVSVGVVGSDELLDLCYEEDHRCAVDMNVVMTDKGRYVEIQGTAEMTPFDRNRLLRLLDLAQVGLEQLFKMQRAALEGIL